MVFPFFPLTWCAPSWASSGTSAASSSLVTMLEYMAMDAAAAAAVENETVDARRTGPVDGFNRCDAKQRAILAASRSIAQLTFLRALNFTIGSLPVAWPCMGAPSNWTRQHLARLRCLSGRVTLAFGRISMNRTPLSPAAGPESARIGPAKIQLAVNGFTALC